MIQECSEHKGRSPFACSNSTSCVWQCFSGESILRASILAVGRKGRDFLPHYVSLPSPFLLSCPTQLSLESPHRRPKTSQWQPGYGALELACC